jgi:uncharacterized protein
MRNASRANSGRKVFVFFTTDYILDEALTLFKAGGLAHITYRLWQVVDGSEALAFRHVGPERFTKARTYFERRADHAYSFTDCTSFILMKEFGATDALTTDRHFEEAGFKALLAD